MTKSRSILGLSFVILTISLCATFLGLISTTNAQTLVKPEALLAGDLIRGESYSAVYYYGTDGFRYVFPNDKTYFTWYQNFDTVKWVSDADLSSIQIGGNVTYKPGIRMIKINSDPKVYAVGAGGSLRFVNGEAVALGLYGSNWNKMIDDVPDGFFSNYKMSSSIEIATSFSASGEKASAVSINVDKGLKAATVVTITSSGYSPASVTVKAGTVVQFMNSDSAKHSASGDDQKWGTGTLNAGQKFSRYFKNAGLYTFHDAYGTATGTVIVE